MAKFMDHFSMKIENERFKLHEVCRRGFFWLEFQKKGAKGARWQGAPFCSLAY